jgi:hypothetical protein
MKNVEEITMAINFTKNVEQYTTSQKNSRVKNFMEFTSKKQLEDVDILNAQELEFVKSIKGTFSFALHKEERYMAITLYKASNSERKYNFLVVDLQEQAIAEVDSIKNAKSEILELVLADKAKSIVEEELSKNEETEELANEEPAMEA